MIYNMASRNEQEDNAKYLPVGFPGTFPPIFANSFSYPMLPPQWSQPPWIMYPQGDPTNFAFQYSTMPQSTKAELPNNDYMVNSMSRIYNNEDGTIEIERVKVHRRSGAYEQPSLPNFAPLSPCKMKVPPPRRKRQAKTTKFEQPAINTPYIGHLPQMPYCYPYPYGVMPYMPGSMFTIPGFQSPDGSEGVTLRTESEPGDHCAGKSCCEDKICSNSPSSEIPAKESLDRSTEKDNQISLEAESKDKSMHITKQKDLIYAFRKLERNVDSFRSHLQGIECVNEDLNTSTSSFTKGDDRYSDSSTLIVDDSQRGNDDTFSDTDSTEIVFSSSDEEEISLPEEYSYHWVLKAGLQDEFRNEDTGSASSQIRLWRKQLVKALCQGQGLDDADWTTFQLLIKESQSISDKIELLNESMLCSLNNNIGVALLRNSLLQVIKYGEILLKPPTERIGSWSSIQVDKDEPWTQVKGCIAILHLFGYRLKNKKLIFKEKNVPENIIIASLTVDILILTEEFRLYLTGIHNKPNYVTDLFTKNQVNHGKDAMKSFTVANIKKPSIQTVEQLSDVTKTSFVKEVPKYANSDELRTISPEENVKVNTTEHSISEIESVVLAEPRKCALVKLHNHAKSSEEEQKKIKVEEHVYEEIEEVKAKVEAIRKYSLPPPLPPKSRRHKNLKNAELLSQQQSVSESSPDVSQSGSLSIRKRKRRAPMPPSFSENTLANNNTNEKLFNPVSEKKSTSTTKCSNPFYEAAIKPKGYEGKNPFYDDIDQQEQQQKEVKNEEIAASEQVKKSHLINESIAENNGTTGMKKSGEKSIANGKLKPNNNEIAAGNTIKNSDSKTEHNTEKLTGLMKEIPANDGEVPADTKIEKSLPVNKPMSGTDLAECDINVGKKSPGSGKETQVNNEIVACETIRTNSSPTGESTSECNIQREENLIGIGEKGPKVSEGKENVLIINEHGSAVSQNEKCNSTTDLCTPATMTTSKNSESTDNAANSNTTIENETSRRNEQISDEQSSSTQGSKLGTDCETSSPIIHTVSSIPPPLPPKATLRLVDDIPYIDTNIREEMNNDISKATDSNISQNLVVSSRKENTMVMEPGPNLSLTHVTCPSQSPPPPPTTSPPSSDDYSSDSPVLFLENDKLNVANSEPSDIKEASSNLLTVDDQLSDDIKRMSLHKETWVFPHRNVTEEKPARSSSRCSSDTDSNGYEIPENPDKISPKMNQKPELAVYPKDKPEDSAPKPFTRKKNLPPRPPKPKEENAPDLPPKGIPSSLNISSKIKYSLAKTRSSPSKWKHKSFSILRQGQNSLNGEPESEKLKTKPKSTPSSPQLGMKTHKTHFSADRTRRSWPSLLCECMNPPPQ